MITKPKQAAGATLRTFQERVQNWRAKNGPPQEVFFPQAREPGKSVQYDGFCLNELEVTIAGQPYKHLGGHTVFPFSNWEWVVPCLSESSLSLRAGLQAGLWNMGGVAEELWTDNSSAATHAKEAGKETRELNENYKAFSRHLRMTPRTINIACPNEQGDVESAHRHFKRRLKNHLMLRGSSDFANEAQYCQLLAKICSAANQLRAVKVAAEHQALRPLPALRYPETDCEAVPVSSFSTVKVKKCIYSVPSRLIGFMVDAQVSESEVSFHFDREEVARFPRAIGQQSRINFRHIITWLARKPGAFRGYIHRDELFPSLPFRQAYDQLLASQEATADRDYLQLLVLAADLGETKVAEAIGQALRAGTLPEADALRAGLQTVTTPAGMAPFTPNLAAYDRLLQRVEASA